MDAKSKGRGIGRASSFLTTPLYSVIAQENRRSPMRRLSLLLFFLTGCVGNSGLSTSGAANDNIYNLSRIYLGMSESEVLKIMHSPHSQRTFEHKGDTYDVWFYVTRPTSIGQTRLVPQNLTPLTFKNGTLIGWGFEYYNYLLKQETGTQKVKKTQTAVPEEDEGLEKALQTPPGKQTQPSGQKTLPKEKAPNPANQPAPTPSQPTPPKPQKKPSPSKSPSQYAPGPAPLQTPVQPTPQQPPPPVQPNSNAPSSLSSMSSHPKNSKEEKPAPDSEKSPERKKKEEKPYLDEEGEKMMEEENEQNFNYW